MVIALLLTPLVRLPTLVSPQITRSPKRISDESRRPHKLRARRRQCTVPATATAELIPRSSGFANFTTAVNLPVALDVRDLHGAMVLGLLSWKLIPALRTALGIADRKVEPNPAARNATVGVADPGNGPPETQGVP